MTDRWLFAAVDDKDDDLQTAEELLRLLNATNAQLDAGGRQRTQVTPSRVRSESRDLKQKRRKMNLLTGGCLVGASR